MDNSHHSIPALGRFPNITDQAFPCGHCPRETITHIFAGCDFAKKIWRWAHNLLIKTAPHILISIDPIYSRSPTARMHRILTSFASYDGTSANFLRMLVSAVLYQIWKTRNAWMYENIKPNIITATREIGMEIVKQAEGHQCKIGRTGTSQAKHEWFRDNFVRTSVYSFSNTPATDVTSLVSQGWYSTRPYPSVFFQSWR